jgi:transcription elongation factor GreA
MTKKLTLQGMEKLKKELEHLKKIERPEVIQRIKHAASHGDLRENAGYHAAREDQGFIESRIRQLEDTVNQAEIIEKKEGEGVQLGSSVVLETEDGKESYQVVGPEEADIMSAKISSESSLGRSLLGKKKGDQFEYETPGGIRKCKILNVD